MGTYPWYYNSYINFLLRSFDGILGLRHVAFAFVDGVVAVDALLFDLHQHAPSYGYINGHLVNSFCCNIIIFSKLTSS